MRLSLTYIGAILIVLNSLIGLITTSYPTFNWVLANAVIMLQLFIINYILTTKLKNGFKIGILPIFVIAGFLSLIAAIITDSNIADNLSLIVLALILSVELILLILVKSFSK